MPTTIAERLVLLCAGLLLAACGQAVVAAVAQEPDGNTACALDGMVLKDFPGSKAQVHYADGKPDFYCDLMELFAVMLAPEHKRKVTAVFVQDSGKTDWANPSGHWIAAREAVYVVGSRKQGSMGPTFGAFSSPQDAQAFAQKEGGTVVAFDKVTAAMLHTGGVAGDARH